MKWVGKISSHPLVCCLGNLSTFFYLFSSHLDIKGIRIKVRSRYLQSLVTGGEEILWFLNTSLYLQCSCSQSFCHHKARWWFLDAGGINPWRHENKGQWSHWGKQKWRHHAGRCYDLGLSGYQRPLLPPTPPWCSDNDFHVLSLSSVVSLYLLFKTQSTDGKYVIGWFLSD